jgi:alkylation response protein AidB-like acyl-CoA dehydrogenase
LAFVPPNADVPLEISRSRMRARVGDGTGTAAAPCSAIYLHKPARWSTITRIYEGTNQIQRMVMARQLLKGW